MYKSEENKQDNLHIYSTDEHIVGTWIDNKPIYEKTITINVNSYTDSSSRRNFIYTLPDTDKYFLFCKGDIEVLSGTYYTGTRYNIPSAFMSAEMGTTCSVTFSTSDKQFVFFSSKSWGITSIRIRATLQYTKTNDFSN